MKNKGVLIVISGFAGSGKGTITKELLNRYDNYRLSVSATTRNPRPQEVDGKDYFFVTREEFEEMIAKEELLEYTEYVGNYYGTPKKYVEQMLSEGKDVILEIEYIGAFNAKKAFPEAVLIFITPPSVKEVYNRLKGRNTESEDVIIKRIKRGQEEAEIIDKYDYVIVNDDVETAILDIHNTIQCSKCSSVRNGDFVNKLKNEFDEFLKNY
ncbi:MAG: guanylate kinase [Lachnospiraceae bacterium]|nr:guanylate kinase [Lachnospiraceae bacterium]